MKQSLCILLTMLVAIAALTGCATTMDTGAIGDAEIAQIVMSANHAEVLQGQLASTRAWSETVRDFARTLVTHHTAANQSAIDIAVAAGITAMDSDVSRQLERNTTRSLETLGTWRGADFDRTFIDNQIKAHEWLLETIDTRLFPSARNPQLRSLLETERGSAATHLARAKQLRSSL